MIGPLTPRRLATVAVLCLAWCVLWQQVSIANVASGLLVAVVATHPRLGTPGVGGVRLVPLVKLTWLVLTDLARSTVDVAYEVLTPTDYTDEIVIDVPVDPSSRSHFFLLTSAITLTPGTAVVEADHARSTLRLHLLHRDKQDEIVAHVHQLARLAHAALPVPAESDEQNERTNGAAS